ncbi:hypothetical protein A6R68_21100, partial [Neotoma lepida]
MFSRPEAREGQTCLVDSCIQRFLEVTEAVVNHSDGVLEQVRASVEATVKAQPSHRGPRQSSQEQIQSLSEVLDNPQAQECHSCGHSSLSSSDAIT